MYTSSYTRHVESLAVVLSSSTLYCLHALSPQNCWYITHFNLGLLGSVQCFDVLARLLATHGLAW